MKIIVTCNVCSNDDKSIDMKTDGPLHFNPTTKSQAQAYVCPICRVSISVSILVD